jgi:hypothetical protein
MEISKEKKIVDFGNLRNLRKVEELEEKIGNIKSQMLFDKRLMFVLILFTFICGIPLYLHYSGYYRINIVIVITLWIFCAFFIFIALIQDSKSDKEKITTLENLKKIQLGLPDNLQDTYFDKLVKLNIENLSSYYFLVKNHTKSSFQLTIVALVIGFLFIIIGLVIGIIDKNAIQIGYIASGCGLFIEFISGIIFYQYNKAIMQLKSYHDSLIDVQNILLSFKLIESTSDENKRSEMIAKMIEYIIGKKIDKSSLSKSDSVNIN